MIPPVSNKINNLIIVESPFKAKTIKKIVGNKFEVMSSQGHICDLPKKDIGIDINNDFKPNYIIDSLKKKIVSELKNKSKSADVIYLASDDDREGEAISWHLKNVLELTDDKIRRIVFHEITENAIKKAILNPRNLNLNLVNSQQARRILDRLVGYKISPILWSKIKTGLSAGRVQSVAVRLIVERENEILSFKPTIYYKITSLLTYKNKIFKSELKNNLQTKEDVIILFKKIINSEFIVKKVEKKKVTKEPVAPFTTSSLQQEANIKLGFSVSNTMKLAQRLYESGKITYMRTDSVTLSEDAIKQARDVISREYGERYIQNRQFKVKSKLAQEAHEAIRPTNLSETIASNDQYEQKLYNLIRNRCLASQMADAIINKTTVIIKNTNLDDEEFITRGSIIEFDGFLKLYQTESDDNDEDENILPDLKENDNVEFVSITGKEKSTRPKSRFTEATLVRELEEKGIGRPSTYAPIISTIQNRGYIVKASKEGTKREVNVITMSNNKITESTETKTENTENNKLYPTDIAVVVNDFLVSNFSDITNYDFTANIENELDSISEGKLDWVKFLHKFYDGLLIELSKCSDIKVELSSKLLGVDPKTNKNMYLKYTKYGPVLQLGDNDVNDKPKYFNLLKNQNINDFTLQDGLNLIGLPRLVGKYNGADIFVHNGKFGPYIKCGDLNAPIFDLSRVFNISEDEAIAIIKKKENYKKKS